MADLHIPLKGVYFDQIAAGTKLAEYRLRSPHWRKRLEGRTYSRIILTRGYPRRGDSSRTLVKPWLGYVEATINHPHFGAETVEVFAIDVSGSALAEQSHD